VLEVLGTVTHVGPAGAGAGAKLVANLALLGSLAALAECAALADALDLDTSTLQAVLGRTPLAEQAVKRRTALAGEPGSPRFVLRHAHKDAALAEQALVLAGREAPVATGTRQRLAAALAAGLGDEDYTAMLTPACWRT
jgi:3-hydroxyisobutyrate dehydrogenase-like beta-hydroxyacid dehydrogenase